MRIFKTYNDDPISSPKNDIVCTESRFISRKPVTLILREKLFEFSDDDFIIKDTNNTEYFKCKEKINRFKEKKTIYDLCETPILNIHHKILSLRKYIKIYSDENEQRQLASIHKKSLFSIKKYIIEFYNQATEQTEYLEMKCDYFSFTCGIFYGKEKEGAPLICKVIKRLDAKLLFTSQENYYCQIAPGVDLAFMVALSICFDEYKNENDH